MHPNEFLRLDSSAKSLEPVIATLCRKHKPADAAAILLKHAIKILLEVMGPELVAESFLQLASGLNGPEPKIEERRNEMTARAFILARTLGSQGSADLFCGAATELMKHTLGKKATIDYFINVAADLDHETDLGPEAA